MQHSSPYPSSRRYASGRMSELAQAHSSEPGLRPSTPDHPSTVGCQPEGTSSRNQGIADAEPNDVISLVHSYTLPYPLSLQPSSTSTASKSTTAKAEPVNTAPGSSQLEEESARVSGKKKRGHRTRLRTSSAPAELHRIPLVFQSSLDLTPICYSSFVARAAYCLCPFLYLANIGLSLYLDYTALYILAQIAIHPAPSGEIPFNQISGQPLANPWWIAFGFHAAASLIWLLGIVAMYEIYHCYILTWRSGRQSIARIYFAAPSFRLSCGRSFPIFCFLWRLRISAFRGIGRPPASRIQGMIEVCFHWRQNWPTVLTLIPRAAVILVLLLSFSSTAASGSASFDRDVVYFRDNGTLSTYPLVVLTIYLCWALFRILVVLFASCAVLVIERKLCPDRYTALDSDLTRDPGARGEWQKRTEQRIAELLRRCRQSEPGWAGNSSCADVQQSNSNGHAVTFYIPVEGGAKPSLAARDSASVRTSSIPMRQKRPSSETSESLRTIFPSVLPDDSASPPCSPSKPLSIATLQYGQASVTEGGQLDEEELERLEWERHPPLSPKGRMIQARQEFAVQQEERSYWHARPAAPSPDSARHEDDRELAAIAEESEEEASLRRSNSNRQTISSRQSSLRRPNTALGILDENATIAE